MTIFSTIDLLFPQSHLIPQLNDSGTQQWQWHMTVAVAHTSVIDGFHTCRFVLDFAVICFQSKYILKRIYAVDLMKTMADLVNARAQYAVPTAAALPTDSSCS